MALCQWILAEIAQLIQRVGEAVVSPAFLRPLRNFAGCLAGANGIATILMIETRAGVEQAAQIAATQGVDMVFIGNGDLALSLGVDPARPKYIAACAAIRRASDAAGVPCAIFTGSLAGARQRRDEGYRMVVVANDIDLVGRAWPAPATLSGTGLRLDDPQLNEK
jgi:2-keto-3-deoxy-L-rhamnonate aldolase RhmA